MYLIAEGVLYPHRMLGHVFLWSRLISGFLCPIFVTIVTHPDVVNRLSIIDAVKRVSFELALLCFFFFPCNGLSKKTLAAAFLF